MNYCKEINVSVRVPKENNCEGCSFKQKVGLVDNVCGLFGFVRIENNQKIDECLKAKEAVAGKPQSDIAKSFLRVMDVTLEQMEEFKKAKENSKSYFVAQETEPPVLELKPLYNLYISYKDAGFSAEESLKLIAYMSVLRK